MTLHPAEAEDLDFDDANITHLAQPGKVITPVEVYQVWDEDPIFVPNKKGLTATWLMQGDTYGGRSLTIAVVCQEVTRRLRPITGWETTPGELTRWR